MAVEIASVSATQKQSIARVELFTDAALSPDQWRLVVHFEDGLYDADGKLTGPTQFGTRRIERAFGDIKAQSVTAAGQTVTVAQLAALIQAAAYAFRAADIAAAVALAQANLEAVQS